MIWLWRGIQYVHSFLASYRWMKYDMIWYHAYGMMICWNSFSHGRPTNFQPFPGNVVLPRADWRIKLISICYPEGLGWDLDGLQWHGAIVLASCQSQFIRAGNGLLCGQIDVLPHNCTEDWSQHNWGCFGPLQSCFFVLSDVSEWRRTSGIIVCFSDGSFSVMVLDKAQSGLTTQQLVARMYLLNDVRQTLPNLIGCIMLCLSPCPACTDLMKLAVANLITCFLFGGFRFCTTHIVSDSAWHSFLSSKMIPQLALGSFQGILSDEHYERFVFEAPNLEHLNTGDNFKICYRPSAYISREAPV